MFGRKKELNRLRAWQEDVQNREAAVCPEDMPFDEYIKALHRMLTAARADVKMYSRFCEVRDARINVLHERIAELKA